MKLNKLLKTAAFAAATALSLPQAVAAWTPEEPIVLRIGFGAGGETDTMGRVLAATIERQTGWDVVVENRPGGGGVAMLSALVNEAADGLVLGMAVNIRPSWRLVSVLTQCHLHWTALTTSEPSPWQKPH